MRQVMRDAREEKSQETMEMTGFDGPEVDTSETDESSNDVSLLDLLIVIGRRKKFLVVSTLAVATLALIVTLLIPKRFTATTTVLPPQQASSLSAALLSQMGNLGALGSLAGGSLGLKNPTDMTIALLKSRSVEDALIQRFDLMKLYKEKRPSQARKALEDHTSIESNLKDGLIRIEIEDKDPHRAAEMANAYVQEYQKFSQHLAIGEAGQRRLFFEQQLVEAKNNLATAEEAMKSSQQKSGMIQLDSQAKALIESVAALRAQIAAKEVQIRSLSLSETPTNPDILMAREQLGALQSQLRQLGGSQAGADSDLIVPRGKIPEAGMDYIRKLRDVKYNELIFELLAKQFELAKLDEAREGAIIQVVDPAVVPDMKSFPKIRIIVSVVTFIWILLAVFGILLLEKVHQAEKSPEDFARLQVLKTIWVRTPRRKS
jgi:tyrosine-protein kinase Etk/Wzc